MSRTFSVLHINTGWSLRRGGLCGAVGRPHGAWQCWPTLPTREKTSNRAAANSATEPLMKIHATIVTSLFVTIANGKEGAMVEIVSVHLAPTATIPLPA